ncbi:3-hydroxyacyl-CoA dehydrogenase [Angulomicrobium tetraedrale]|uniref:3-hydroxyacyl-CoA dehydrogenase n=1 Tax=Ancylobacter tetraedralis TaxID=217068 RepID=A0A839ZDQ5_9HYPH|nr:3-hydroxyacyl-CoA dehydrogenase NAD-binding domain-containing protein [Ancylobacter tetraedralis]MBB3772796.1 3-hydroxyacyl-CoA dehydrogenase [Ancylobacter tetraedralis]
MASSSNPSSGSGRQPSPARPLVAILGCGLIGQSWAALFLHHGLDVAAWDPDRSTVEAMPERLVPLMAQLRELGDTQPGTFRPARSLADAVRTACWVQENAPEKVPVKAALYAEVEATAPPGAIIASSTSSLTWTELSAGMADPARLVTAHPFNPPHLMPLVEIYAANDAVRGRAVAFYEALGRKTVTLRKDATGHIANRLASALWREAVYIVAEGIADVPEVDAALVHGPGLRWSIIGAHMAYHLGGGPGGMRHYLDHLGPSQERRWSTLGTPRLTPEVQAMLVEGIEREVDGRSINELEAERDRAIIHALRARQEAP